jgi:FAD synthase
MEFPVEVHTKTSALSSAVAIIGGWDPLLTVHFDVFNSMQDRAKASDRSSLVVMLEPNPILYVQGASNWPVYNDLGWRVKLILDAGIDTVATVHCDETVLEKGIRDLLLSLQPHARITELWLGASQTLGRGDLGNATAIARVTRELGIELSRLGYALDSFLGSHARRFVLAGKLASAIELVQRPPTFARPAGDRLRLAWPAGRYRALPVDAAGRQIDEAIAVELISNDDGFAYATWPREADNLQFVTGPDDP